MAKNVKYIRPNDPTRQATLSSTNPSLDRSPHRPKPNTHSIHFDPGAPAVTKMPTQQTHSLPLRRHDSAAHLTTIKNTTKPLMTPFPCSHRRHHPHKQPTSRPLSPPSPTPQPPQQDRLQTALLYLARAAAQLPPASAAAESLYDFAAPNWAVERWGVEVEGWRAAAGAREGWGGGDGEIGGREKGGAGDWVRRAIGVLKREGEEGEYWRDGRDLEVLWGRVGGDGV